MKKYERDKKQNIDLCRKLHADGRLIPFIGAGLSTRFNLPSSLGLMDIIAKELGWDTPILKQAGDLYQVAEYYAEVKGGIGALRSILDRSFIVEKGKISTSRAHMALAELQSPIIYTTNWDRIIETAFEIKAKPYKTVTNIRDFAELKPNITQIIKFHGDFTDDSSLVLTETSYLQRLEFETSLDIKLRADILGKLLLFVGYNFTDINIRYMLYKLNKLKRESKSECMLPTAIMVTFAPSEVQHRLLSKYDVLVIDLDPINKDESIDEFIEGLE